MDVTGHSVAPVTSEPLRQGISAMFWGHMDQFAVFRCEGSRGFAERHELFLDLGVERPFRVGPIVATLARFHAGE